MYLAILTYKSSFEEREPYIPGHFAFLDEGYANNLLVVSGRMMTGRGGVILSPLTSRVEFETLLKNDPFMIHDLADYEIIAFDPTRYHPDFASFIREPEKRPIELVAFTDEWQKIFEKESALIATALGETLVTIHHIGSTAIPEIVAKPIIDMVPVVKNIEDVDRLIPALVALGYEARGEFGMPGRRFFVKNKPGTQHFNVHIFEEGHSDIERHLRFRDYLRSHPEDAQAYSELKENLVKQSSDDMEKYSWGKEDFVKAIDVRATLWKTLSLR
jgi:GrpB-like predicted nucleotidyltransferase (UPF0157 family)/uncharacterized protein YciI